MQTPTQQSESHTVWHGRLLRRLNVIVDDRWAYSIRLAAVKAAQQMLDDRNPLRSRSAEDLLDSVLQPWDVRLYLERGRGVLRTVTRPPISMRDVWA